MTIKFPLKELFEELELEAREKVQRFSKEKSDKVYREIEEKSILFEREFKYRQEKSIEIAGKFYLVC